MKIKENYYTLSEYNNYIYIKNQIENDKFNYQKYKVIIFKKINNIPMYLHSIIITDKYNKHLEIDNNIKSYIDKKLA